MDGWVLVIQSCPTLCDPMGCSPPGSSIHGLLQARILEWVAISFSRGSSQPRDWICKLWIIRIVKYAHNGVNISFLYRFMTKYHRMDTSSQTDELSRERDKGVGSFRELASFYFFTSVLPSVHPRTICQHDKYLFYDFYIFIIHKNKTTIETKSTIFFGNILCSHSFCYTK